MFDPLLPFEDNYFYRNYVFSLADVDTNGNMTTWQGGSPSYQFQTPATNDTPIPSLLATSDTRWLAYNTDINEMGVSVSLDQDLNWFYTMSNGVQNLFGLPFSSAEIVWGNTADATANLQAGGTLENVDGDFYPETAQPGFQTVEYDFWRVAQYGDEMYAVMDALPGDPNFAPTNTSRLMIAPVGSSINLAGYAKLAVQNGYSGVYGYLGQYFDTAYEVDDNGNVTTNQTGLLSPYGQFFATQPGPAALVTMPDIDTGERGTCTVYCVSLQLDANHDGNMDLSFNGTDATSQNSPFVFWCNNNFDRWDNDGIFSTPEQDDVQQGSDAGGELNADPDDPDCNYRDLNGNRIIPCTRDLEDFARLRICGFSDALITNLPYGSTITLSWGDVGNPNPNNPTIDIFSLADPDGGTGYLTNETTAAGEVENSSSLYVGRIAPGQGMQLQPYMFDSQHPYANHNFIWCGVTNGTGALTMTIADASSNVLAQSTVYIQINDIKQMYERWTVGENPAKPPLSTPEPASDDGYPAGLPAFQYAAPQSSNTTYILHVHGFNMPTWTKDRYAETEFKRLYWQGYQGRFGEFRWPTTQQGIFNATSAFDDSENQAWSSAPGLLNLLTNLNAEYPGNVYLTAHSHGNVVAGEALRLATQQGLGQLVNTYVAMQGAVDSHAYDPTTPTRPVSFATPDRYGQYYTNGAASYFSGSASAGTYVNFFNTNDYALTILWQPDQNLKPDAGYGYSSTDDTWWQQGAFTNIQMVFPQDAYTIFSYCDQAHGYALGAQLNVSGVFSTNNQVNLPNVWPPDPLNNDYRAHIWHSAEFRSDYAQRWQFWNQVLTKMKLN
jgi:hypothetical protein